MSAQQQLRLIKACIFSLLTLPPLLVLDRPPAPCPRDQVAREVHIQTLEANCQQGSGVDCRHAGDVHLHTSGDRIHALDWYGQGCRHGDTASCKLFKSLQDAPARGTTGASSTAAPLPAHSAPLHNLPDLIKRCEQGDATSCTLAGFAQPAQQAAQMFQQACQRGHALGCLNHAYLLTRSKELVGATAAAAQACRLGDAAGCQYAGYLSKTLGTQRKDAALLQQAGAFYLMSCKLQAPEPRLPHSCTGLGRLIEQGLFHVDSAQAALYTPRALYSDACQKKYAMGCYNLGQLQRDEEDYPGAATSYEVACLLGEASACYNLAFSAEDGDSAPADPVGALQLFARACRLGHQQACQEKLLRAPAAPRPSPQGFFDWFRAPSPDG